MRWLRFFTLILVATIVQKGMLARWDYKPDLLIVLLVFFAGAIPSTRGGMIQSHEVFKQYE